MTPAQIIGAAALGLGLGLAGCAGSAANAPPPADALDTIEAAQLFHFGNQLADAGDSIRAEQYLAAAMERGYPAAEVIPRLMEVCVQASRLSAALSYAEPYLERHEGEWPLRLLVASIQLSLNQTTSARVNLSRVIAEAPSEPEPYYLMGVLLRDRMVDSAGANEHFARYLELAPDGRHVGEARLSISGNYVPPAEVPPAETERERPEPPSGESTIPGPAPTTPLPGPTRLAPHATDDATAPTSGSGP